MCQGPAKVKDKCLSTGKERHVLWSAPIRLYLKGVTMEVDEGSSEGPIYFFFNFFILLLLLLAVWI